METPFPRFGGARFQKTTVGRRNKPKLPLDGINLRINDWLLKQYPVGTMCSKFVMSRLCGFHCFGRPQQIDPPKQFKS